MATEKSKDELTKEALDFLKGQHVGVVSTVSPDSTPHAAAVFYVVDDSWGVHFYFFSKDYTKKYKDLLDNSSTSMVVYTEDPPMVVQIEGEAELVEKKEEEIMATSRLFDLAVKSSKFYDPPIAKMKPGGLGVIKINVKSLRWADFRKSANDSPSGPFHQIIP